jgi:hypothetical protein
MAAAPSFSLDELPAVQTPSGQIGRNFASFYNFVSGLGVSSFSNMTGAPFR